MLTGIGGYELKCESCKAKRNDVGFDIHMIYLYANQYKTKIRLFCSICGAVHDVTTQDGKEPIIEKHSMRAAIGAKYKSGIPIE